MRYSLLIVLAVIVTSCHNSANNTKNDNKTWGNGSQADNMAIDNPISADATVKIGQSLSLQKLEQMSDDEARNWKPCNEPPCEGLVDQGFDTLYNDHSIICIKRVAEYMGAYPSTGISYYDFDTRTGERITAKDILIASKMQDLVEECNNRIAYAIKDSRLTVASEDTEAFNSGIESRASFTVKNLDEFFMKNDRVIFHYDFDFIHALKALQPNGDIAFTAQQLRPYIKPDGPLAFMIK